MIRHDEMTTSLVRATRRSRLKGLAATASTLAVLATACSAPESAPGAAQAASNDACSAAGWPSRNVEFIVPFGPGGGMDPLGRALSAALEEQTGKSWSVTNVPGAGGAIGATQLLSARPDGYTLGMASSSILGFQPLINDEIAYAGADDFSVLAGMVKLPSTLVVRADAPWQTIEEFIRHAEENPGQLKIGSAGLGSATDQATLDFIDETGLDVRGVQYSDGSGASMTALLSGETDADFSNAVASKGQLDAGEIRMLAVTGDERLEKYPDVPTFVELGYDVVIPSIQVALAPAIADEDLRSCLRTAVGDYVGSAEFEELVLGLGYQYTPLSPEDAEAQIEEDGAFYLDLLEKHSERNW